MPVRVCISAVIVLASLLVPASAQVGASTSTPDDLHPVIVDLAPGATVDDLVPGLADAVAVERVGRDGTWVALEVDAEALAALEGSGLVESIVPNREVELSLDRSVPAVGAADLPAVGFDGSGSTIVVVDTGVDVSHPSLAGSLVAEACFAVDCPPGGSVEPGAGGACDVAMDRRCGHGTHVAAIALGRGGPRGVAPGAQLVSVRIFGFNDNDAFVASDAGIRAALEWIRDEHRSWPGTTVAVNLSLGFAGFEFSETCDQLGPAVVPVIRTLVGRGIAVVAAAGNASPNGPTFVNGVQPPACFSPVTAVSATYTSGGIADFAHRSDLVTLVAPGAAHPSGGGITSAEPGGGLRAQSGTSMAVPHVVGVMAIMREAEPDLRGAALVARLRDSGLPVADPFADRSYSLVRVDRALCDVPRRVGCARATADNGQVTVSWVNLVAADRGATEVRLTPSDGSPATSLPADVSSHRFTGLANRRPVWYLVEVLDGDGAVLASARTNASVPKPLPGAHGFSDVVTTAFYESGIRWARTEGVTTGVGGSDVFAPQAAVTRGEMVTFLWRMAGQPRVAVPAGFDDVRAGVYYEPAVAWARANRITLGYAGTNEFRPDAPVTRGELVTFLWRLTGQASPYRPHGFLDTVVGAFYEQPVRWASFHGVTTGVGGTQRFAPDAAVTRGEAVTFLQRAASDPAVWRDARAVPATVAF